jgi:hypothetical protein
MLMNDSYLGQLCVSCIQYDVFLCCVFGLYVVCLVSSITCFCVVFLVYSLCVLFPVLRVSVLCFWFLCLVSLFQYYVFVCCVIFFSNIFPQLFFLNYNFPGFSMKPSGIEILRRFCLPPVVCRRTDVLFTLFVFVCVLWCPTHIMLCFYFVFLRLVYSMLSDLLYGIMRVLY